PSVVQTAQRDDEALSLLMQQVLARDSNVRESDAALPRPSNAGLAAVLLEDVDPIHVGRTDERRHALPLLTGLRILDALLGHHREKPAQRRRRAPLLLAVEDVVLAVLR